MTLSTLLVCAITLSPLNVLASDGGYTVQYFENETDFFNKTGISGGYAGTNANQFPEKTNGYITTTGDYASDYVSYGSFGSYTMWKYDTMTVPTDTPPFFYQGTLMVGLRQIGNALKYGLMGHHQSIWQLPQTQMNWHTYEQKTMEKVSRIARA